MAVNLGALNTKLGPAPAWMWLAAGGLGLWLATRSGLLGRKSGSTIPASAPPAGLVPPGYVPAGSQPAFQQPASSSGAQVQIATARQDAAIWPDHPGQVPLYGNTKPGAGGIEWVPAGIQLQIAGPAGPYGIPVNYLGRVLLASPAQWDISGGSQPPTYIAPAQGGASPRRGGQSPTRRSDTHWSWHGHPLLKQQAHFPHFVIGGQGGAALHGVARSAGLHPARLMAANPHLHGPARGGFTDNVSAPMYGRGIPTSRGYALAVGGPEDAMGGFTDNESQPVSRAGQPTSRAGRLMRGGPDDEGMGGAHAAWPTETYAVGGPDDEGAGGPRGPRLPPGHVARAGQLIRVR